MKWSVWTEAARMRTLPASFIPVLTGGALAWHHQLINWPVSVITLCCAVLIQIATNFANDYFDYKHGADTGERIGFTRATSTGDISPAKMLTVTLVLFFVAFLLGLILVWHAGWPVLLIGLLSITAGLLYTGGPYPLAYHGLGDLFVFLFFGIIAVTGTYYVNSLQWSTEALLASIAIGALSTMILVANNYRDVHTDRKAAKNTLVVLFGERFSRWQFLGLALLAFSVPPCFYLYKSYPPLVMLPLILSPWAILLIRRFWLETEKKNFNRILIQTAQLMAIYGILFSMGIVLS
ncbi:MAG: 1,4-dihydroxy-2-naphthoate polyprenyltransferase [Balneolales bacterium]